MSINENNKSNADGVISAKAKIAKTEFQTEARKPKQAEAASEQKDLIANAIVNAYNAKSDSPSYKMDKIEDIAASFKDLKDEKIVGEMPQSVLLFGKHKYLTRHWTPLLFAIHNKLIKVVRYLVEYKQVNRRLATINREIQDDMNQSQVLPLLIAISNEDSIMFEYLWSMTELWGIEHLKQILSSIFSHTTWSKGVEILLDSEATQDIYNGLSYEEKKQFMIEMNYRYMLQASGDIKKIIKKMMHDSPYGIVTLHFLMAEENEANTPLIKKWLDLPFKDYAKMKLEANKEFIDAWNATLSRFQSLGGGFAKTSSSVTSKFIFSETNW